MFKSIFDTLKSMDILDYTQLLVAIVFVVTNLATHDVNNAFLAAAYGVAIFTACRWRNVAKSK